MRMRKIKAIMFLIFTMAALSAPVIYAAHSEAGFQEDDLRRARMEGRR